jgi:predicted nucleotidyltransferase
MALTKKEKAILEQFKSILQQTLGDRLVEVRLFGSHARGDANEGSDFDVLVIVDKHTDDVRETVLDADVEMMDRYEKLFSALIYDESEWQQARSFPHAWNIEREGVVL